MAARRKEGSGETRGDKEMNGWVLESPPGRLVGVNGESGHGVALKDGHWFEEV